LIKEYNNKDQFVKKSDLKEIISSLLPSCPAKNDIPAQSPDHFPAKPDKHVVVIHSKDSEGFSESTWNTVLKKNVAQKLKNIPITRSTYTKAGKACIFVENDTIMTQVKNVLEESYEVEATTTKKKQIMPKLKQLFGIDTDTYPKYSIDKL
jgi:hypothetical protein